MAKVLLISYYYPPMNNGGVQRPAKLTKFLRQQGHQVTVLTHGWLAQPWTSEDAVWRVDVSRWNWWNIWLLPWRVWRVVADARGWYRTPFDIWQHNTKRWQSRMVKNYRPDVIIATYPSAAVLETGMHLAAAWHCPYIADLRDGIFFEPTNAAILHGPQADYFHQLEQRTGLSAAAVVTVSDPITEYYRQTFPNTPITTITNGFDPDDFANVDQAVQLASGPKHLVFTGRLTRSDAFCQPAPFFETLDEMIASGEITAQNLQVHMIGEFTPDELRLMAPAQAAGVLQQLALVSRATVHAYQRAADALLLITSTSRRGVMTGKLFEYLCAGRPILALTGDTAAGLTVRKTRTGLVANPLDRAAIRQALTDVIKGSIPFQPIAVDAYSWKAGGQLYSRLIEQVITRS